MGWEPPHAHLIGDNLKLRIARHDLPVRLLSKRRGKTVGIGEDRGAIENDRVHGPYRFDAPPKVRA